MATEASISTDYRMMVKALEDAIRLVSEALPLLEQADALFTRYLQAPAEHHTLLHRRHTQIRYSLQGAQTPTETLAFLRQWAGSQAWLRLAHESQLHSLMTQPMWERFKKDAQQAAGDFSLENIETAFAGFSDNAKGIFAESVYDIFIIQSSWARFYDTNSAFKIEQKMHCQQVFEAGENSGYALFGNMREWAHDLDRIFRVLDGKNAADIRTGFAKQLEVARERGDSIYQNAYMRCHCGYKNGNLRIEFLRQDLLDQVNKMVAEYMGNALPHGKKSRKPPSYP
jgi:hypothetical protein